MTYTPTTAWPPADLIRARSDLTPNVTAQAADHNTDADYLTRIKNELVNFEAWAIAAIGGSGGGGTGALLGSTTNAVTAATSLDANGAGSTAATLWLRSGRGSHAAPLALQSGDPLGRVGFGAQYDSVVGHVHNDLVALKAIAAEAHTSTAGGTYAALYTTPLTTIVPVEAQRWLADRSSQFFGPVVLAADPSLPLQAATKQYVDAAGGGNIVGNPMPLTYAERYVNVALASLSNPTVEVLLADSFDSRQLTNANAETYAFGPVYEAIMARTYNAAERTSGWMNVNQTGVSGSAEGVQWDTVGGTRPTNAASSNAGGYGPAFSSRRLAAASSQFCEVTRYGTHVSVYWTAVKSGGCNLLVTIDGVLVDTINTTDATIAGTALNDLGVAYDTGRSARYGCATGYGAHVVRVTASGTGTAQIDAAYFHNRNAVTGYMLARAGRGGFAMTNHLMGVNAATTTTWRDGKFPDALMLIHNQQPQIVTVELGANDARNSPSRADATGLHVGSDPACSGVGATSTEYAQLMTDMLAAIRAQYNTRKVTDVVTNNTTTITSATAAFTADDVGARIYADSTIVDGAQIASVTNATTVVLTAMATGSLTGVTVSIAPKPAIRFLFSPHLAATISPAAWLTSYRTAARNVVAADGDCLLIDLSAVLGDLAVDRLGLTADNVHPDYRGHAAIGQALAAATIPKAGPPGTPILLSGITANNQHVSAVGGDIGLYGDDYAPRLHLGINGNALPTIGATLGALVFDGTTAPNAYQSGAGIRARADETWTAAHAGTRLEVTTAPNGTLSPTVRLIIDNAGKHSFGATVGGALASIDQAGTGKFAHLTVGTPNYGAGAAEFDGPVVAEMTGGLGLLFVGTGFGTIPTIDLRYIGGTYAAPTAANSGDVLGGIHIGAAVEDTTSPPVLYDVAQIYNVATEDYASSGGPSGTSGAKVGNEWQFFTIPNSATPRSDTTTDKRVVVKIGSAGNIIGLYGANIYGTTVLQTLGVLGGSLMSGTLGVVGATTVTDITASGTATLADTAITPPTVTVLGSGIAQASLTGIAGFTGWKMQRINGTVGSPTAIASGDILSSLLTTGQYDTIAGHLKSAAQILVQATQPYTATHFGSKMLFQVASTGGTSALATQLTVDETGINGTGIAQFANLGTGIYYTSTYGAGAAGNTAAQNVAATQAAIDDVYAKGGGTLIVSNDYSITYQTSTAAGPTALILRGKVFLVGYGRALTLAPNSDCDMIQSDPVETYNGGGFGGIIGLQLFANKWHQNPGGHFHCINFGVAVSEAEWIVRDAQLNAANGNGFWGGKQSGGGHRLERVYAHHCNGYGIAVSYDTVVDHCFTAFNGLSGIFETGQSSLGSTNKSYNNGYVPWWDGTATTYNAGTTYNTGHGVLDGGVVWVAVDLVPAGLGAPTSFSSTDSYKYWVKLATYSASTNVAQDGFIYSVNGHYYNLLTNVSGAFGASGGTVGTNFQQVSGSGGAEYGAGPATGYYGSMGYDPLPFGAGFHHIAASLLYGAERIWTACDAQQNSGAAVAFTNIGSSVWHGVSEQANCNPRTGINRLEVPDPSCAVVVLDGASRNHITVGAARLAAGSDRSGGNLSGNGLIAGATYGNGITYSFRDVVLATDGVYYYSLAGSNVGHNPAGGANPTWWDVCAPNSLLYETNSPTSNELHLTDDGTGVEPTAATVGTGNIVQYNGTFLGTTRFAGGQNIYAAPSAAPFLSFLPKLDQTTAPGAFVGLGTIASYGYEGGAARSAAWIQMFTSEAWSSGHHGSYLSLQAIENGTAPTNPNEALLVRYTAANGGKLLFRTNLGGLIALQGKAQSGSAGFVSVLTLPDVTDTLATLSDVAGATGSGGPPSGSAGGDLAGSYPNPTIGALKVTNAAIAAATIDLTAKVTNALPIANGGTASTSASAARTALGLAIGTDVQQWDADLDTIKGLTATTDNFIVSVASAWASRTPAQVRTTLGLVIGTNVQAWDADLDTYAGITPGALGLAILPMTTLTSHGLLLGAGASAPTALAPDSGTTKFLKNSVASDAPTWQAIAQADVTGLTTASTPTFAGINVGQTNLTCYKEGTWTPVFAGTTGSIGTTAYTSQIGVYTRIGNVVYVQGRVTLSNKGSWTGNVVITGLPYTASGQPVILAAQVTALTNSIVSVVGRISAADNRVGFNVRTAASASDTTLTPTDVANTTDFAFAGFYRTTDAP